MKLFSDNDLSYDLSRIVLNADDNGSIVVCLYHARTGRIRFWLHLTKEESIQIATGIVVVEAKLDTLVEVRCTI